MDRHLRSETAVRNLLDYFLDGTVQFRDGDDLFLEEEELGEEEDVLGMGAGGHEQPVELDESLLGDEDVLDALGDVQFLLL